jgi:hypothetical protein
MLLISQGLWRWLIDDALHGADADTHLPGDFLDALALSASGADLSLHDLRRPRPDQCLTLGSLAQRLEKVHFKN